MTSIAHEGCCASSIATKAQFPALSKLQQQCEQEMARDCGERVPAGVGVGEGVGVTACMTGEGLGLGESSGVEVGLGEGDSMIGSGVGV